MTGAQLLPWSIAALDVIGELRAMVAGLQVSVKAMSGDDKPKH